MDLRCSVLATAVALSLLPVLEGCSEPAPATVGGAGGMPVGGLGAAGGASGFMSTGGAGAGGMGGAAASTGGTAADPSAIPATFETVKLVLGGGGGIMPCAAAPCHGVNGMAPPARPLELPPMDDAQLYANLTAYVSDACGGMKLVTPGDPAQSALVTILSGPCGMTPRMPYGCSAETGDCIPDEYIEAVREWIAGGAIASGAPLQ